MAMAHALHVRLDAPASAGLRGIRTLQRRKTMSKATTKQRPAPGRSAASRRPGPAAQATTRRALHVVTDGSGGLPRHMLAALLTQFPSWETTPCYHVFQRDPDRVREIVAAIPQDGLVVSAFAAPELKRALSDACRDRDLPHYDLTGGCVEFLEQHTGLNAANDLQRVHSISAEYLNRIDAWEFSLQHDDSRRLESLHEAQIVLAGLSRVSKTPVCAYLGWLGYRAANVSLAPETKLPAELRKNRARTVGLTIRPRRLVEIRSRRLEINGFSDAIAERDETHVYTELRQVIREVMFAEAEFRKLKIPMIDTTHLTVEETAAKVLQALRMA